MSLPQDLPQVCIRVIAKSKRLDIDDLLAVIESLVTTNPQVSNRKSPQRHPRGGFMLYLAFPDSEIHVVLSYLRQHDWLPCI